MANATFRFTLPQDRDTDQLIIQSSLMEAGNYTTEATVTYEYGTVSHQLLDIDVTKWYRICFSNSSTSTSGPYSAGIYGGDINNSNPFLAIGSETEGANYASVVDIYEYSGLTPEDVPSTRVTKALRSARALIDLKTSDMDIDRFKTNFLDNVSARKYNASLRILKEAEINLALSSVYKELSDDQIIDRMRTGEDVTSVSLGGSGMNIEGNVDNRSLMEVLLNLSDSYRDVALGLIKTLAPSVVPLRYGG